MRFKGQTGYLVGLDDDCDGGSKGGGGVEL